MARLMGRNAVKVLATLFLLSYTKLLQTIIAVLSFTVLEYSNQSRSLVWLPDGNILYLKGKHIPLFVAAIVTLTLSLPFTIILLFTQCLQRLNLRVFFWIVKMKPLLDAYVGPYKDRYRFWTGFLLLVRIALLLTFSANLLGGPNFRLLATTIACFFVFSMAWWFHGIYRKWHLDILESSYFLNLGCLSVAVISVGESEYGKVVATYTSVTIALATFIGILLYHTYKQIRKWKVWRKLSIRLHRKKTHRVELEPLVQEEDKAVQAEPYREPLIYDFY